MDPTSSLDLMRKARAGDREALGELLQRYVPRLRRFAAGRLPRWARDLTDTDDMIQETLLKTVRRIQDFEQRDGGGGLHAYMRQALQRRIFDEVRRVRRRPLPQELGPDAAAPDPSPLEEAIGIEAAARYEQALARLAEADREAVVSRVELGLDYDEIAAALRKPSRDAARMAVIRALVRLAQEMGHER